LMRWPFTLPWRCPSCRKVLIRRICRPCAWDAYRALEVRMWAKAIDCAIAAHRLMTTLHERTLEDHDRDEGRLN